MLCGVLPSRSANRYGICGSVIVWGRRDVVREVGVERKLGKRDFNRKIC